MIAGLKVTVLGTEVAELALKQAKFHHGRKDFYAKQLELYKDMPVNQNLSLYSSQQDPRSAAQSKLDEHESKAFHLEFIASHLKADHEYLLEIQDLVVLGVVRNRF